MQSTPNPGTAEQWKPVPEWEGIYEVSNRGQVRSVERTVTFETVRGTWNCHYESRIMKQHTNASGYRRVTLSHQGRSKSYLVHRLVAAAFLGPCPDGMEVCHGNHNPIDNTVENLRWGTRTENIQDNVRDRRTAGQKKVNCKRGHLLAGPNLVQAQLPLRSCRACALTRSYIYEFKRHGRSYDHVDFQLESDYRFRKIMSEAA